MSGLLAAVREFARDEGGTSLVEYALLLGMIAMACLGAMQALGTSLTNFFGYVGGTLDGISGS